VTATRPLPVVPARRAPAPRPLPLPPPERVAGGCRTRVDGQRCSHPERAHHQVGFGGWRVRCAGCSCRVYRDPWSRALTDVAVAVFVVVVACAGLWWLAIGLLVGGL